MKKKLSDFLSDWEYRPANLPLRAGLTPLGLLLGRGKPALEVVIYDSDQRPQREVVRKIWKERWAGRPVSLLMVIFHDEKCAICGHTEHAREAPPVLLDLDIGHVERLCKTALDLPDHHAVDRFLREQLPETESSIFGIRNQGLLATYVIQRGQHEIDEESWKRSASRATKIRGYSDRKLLDSLGFTVEALSGPASILIAKGSRLALAVFLDQTETAEMSSKRFGGQTPITYALSLAQRHNLKWVIVARGSELRLYPTETDIGVGRRGLTDTYLQVNTELLPDDRLAFLWLAFSAEGLKEGGFIGELLGKSDRYAIYIGERLRDRIYNNVIPPLAKAIVNARNLKNPTSDDLQLTYQMAMLVLFRLLFVAYAEDHDLLPYKTNERYRSRSITQKAKELKKIKENGGGFDPGTSQWDEICILWQNIRDGNTEWGIPPYDGGMFEEDAVKHPAGAELAKIKISNRDYGLMLSNLLLDEETPEGLGPVDFRSLGVREFGTIYEGLLENELSVAETNLTTDRKGNYKPTDDSDRAVVREAGIYLHTRSGARKASGSYYTKAFAVDHLLDKSLEPALEEHLDKVGKLAKTNPDKAAIQLFEFYVADIAMGSGHFLISAIDLIEKRFLNFLAYHALPGVDQELEKLRDAARKWLGETADERLLEKNKLLRRLIARRCIYGVDLNPLAVELARLSVWIHTFIPGLPLSFLDHNLVIGNSLVGIATFREAIEEIERDKRVEKVDKKAPKGQDIGRYLGLFDDKAIQHLEKAKDAIAELRSGKDLDIADIQRAEKADDKRRTVLKGLTALFDIISAKRLYEPKRKEAGESLINYFNKIKFARGGISGLLIDSTALDSLAGSAMHKEAVAIMKAIPPFHFPTAFPEIFLRDRPGFDVIIGNPPWEKAHVEEHEFWSRYFPGFKGFTQTEREIRIKQYKKERPDLERLFNKEVSIADLLRRALIRGPYPGIGTGHPDLSKAFCWRFWDLAKYNDGNIGVVLPRVIWFAKGQKICRETIMDKGVIESLTYLINNREWVFDDVHAQTNIVLSCLKKGKVLEENRVVKIRGPYKKKNSYLDGMKSSPVILRTKDIQSWTDSASIPIFPTYESAEIFLIMQKAPRHESNIGSWRSVPKQGDINATKGKCLMTFTEEKPKGYWPVYKGESFDLWQYDTGSYYAWAEPDRMCMNLQKSRVRSYRMKTSVFRHFPPDWVNDINTLPCKDFRLAFRDGTNRTNSRTVIASLIPNNIILQHSAPYLLWPKGKDTDIAYLLGIFCSIPFDWYVRCLVENHITFHVLNAFPIPRPRRDHVLGQRTVQLAGRLACPDKRFAEWAKKVGVKYGPILEDEKDDMIHELDAVLAHLYGLKEKQLRHIFETFHEGWDYESRMNAVVRHFVSWKKKI